jgi:hypothetical protein
MEKTKRTPRRVTIRAAALGLIVLGILISGCNPSKYCPKYGYLKIESADTVYKDSIVVRDSIIRIAVASDSGYLKAWIECQKGKPVITQIIEAKPGQHAIPYFSIEGNVLTSGCRIDSFAVYKAVRNKEVYRSMKTNQVYVKITNHITGWQNFRLWAFNFAAIGAILYFGIRFLIGKIPVLGALLRKG